MLYPDHDSDHGYLEAATKVRINTTSYQKYLNIAVHTSKTIYGSKTNQTT